MSAPTTVPHDAPLTWLGLEQRNLELAAQAEAYRRNCGRALWTAIPALVIGGYVSPVVYCIVALLVCATLYVVADSYAFFLDHEYHARERAAWCRMEAALAGEYPCP